MNDLPNRPGDEASDDRAVREARFHRELAGFLRDLEAEFGSASEALRVAQERLDAMETLGVFVKSGMFRAVERALALVGRDVLLGALEAQGTHPGCAWIHETADLVRAVGAGMQLGELLEYETPGAWLQRQIENEQTGDESPDADE